MFKRIVLTISLISCLVGSSYAQVQWKKFPYFQNFGGLNDNLSSTEISDNEATDIQNVIFDTGGAIKKRFGYITVPNDPIKKVSTGTTICVNGLAFFKLNDGSRYLVSLSNTDGKATLTAKAYQVGGGLVSGTWTNVDNANLSSSYSNNFQPSFAVAENKLVFLDGKLNYPFYFTGIGNATKLTNNANLPQATILTYHKNQLFLANSTSNPSRVWFSNLDDITTWTATDFFDVQTSDGTQVRALISAFDSLYVFKDKSIWRLAGTNRDDFVLQKMVEGIGTLSNASVKVVNNLIYFTTAQNDVAIYDGAYNVQFISQKIRGTIGALSFNRASNTAGLAFSSYKYNDYDYYCSVSNSPASTNDTVLMFDTAYKAWTKFEGIKANCWTVGDNSSGQNTLYFGDYSGYVHQYPSTSYFDGNVATSAIVAFYQTKWFRYPEIGLGDKYWRLLKTYALNEGTNTFLNIECRSDFETDGKIFQMDLSSSSALWDSSMWDVDKWAGQTILVGRDEVEKGTNMFQIRYSNEIVNQGFTIVGFENLIEPTDRI